MNETIDKPITCDTLTLRRLSGDDIRKDYLPLRFDVLREVGWLLAPVTKPLDLMDSYDETSVSFGIYFDLNLIAAIRLVYASKLGRLPSHPFFPSSDLLFKSARFSEISRAIVAPAYRRLHLFHILNLAANTHVKEQQCYAVYVSVPESLKYQRYWEKMGFKIINTGFEFQDEKIHPDCIASTYCRTITFEKEVESTNVCISQIKNELSNAARIIDERR